MVGLAGKTVVDHVLDSLASLPKRFHIELVCVVGYLGELIEEHVRSKYPHMTSHFVVQENPQGQSHAIKLAEEYLQGPMLSVFADTIMKSDLSFLENEEADSVAWVKSVPDPRRFGVAEVDARGWVRRLVEKPSDVENNLAVVGAYYFKEAERLMDAIGEQMRRDVQLKGEYYLVDAINIMLEQDIKMRVKEVEAWLDAGTPEAILETNRYLLAHGRDNSDEAALNPENVIFPPVFVHPTARVVGSLIGPNVSIGAGCEVAHCIIRDAIIEDEAQATGVILENSLVGRQAVLKGRAVTINAGDNTVVNL